ncbi:DEAD/DEAH box helicase [Leeia sp.]|uniref:DEAD/DEAH box helicase n=1 Tax=Leeia sp. TaxID=2884678 RepID=UPI0035ADDF6D
MLFTELGLSEEILRSIAEQGYTDPTPIQAQAIPVVLSGRDLLAGAQTGTGKTAGFTLPILHRLSNRTKPGPSSGRPPVRALILTPTRELAAQVEESVRTYGKYLKLASMVMFGGVSINPQIKALKSRVDILVATPGRLLDHVSQGTLDLSGVEILVLDEADRMLDMGFIRDIRKILALLPAERQNLLFSATFSDEIRELAHGLLKDPAEVEVARRNAPIDLVTQKVYPVDKERKRDLLIKLIQDHNWFQVLVFTRTKHGANALAEKLAKAGITALAIHGNKSQNARTRALAEFKSGELQVLVATDIAARGLDIDQLPHVVNYELPNVSEDYVHRIGRTGRAGATGEAISLVSPDEQKLLRDIERLTKRDIERVQVEGFEPDPNRPADPPPQQRGRQARPQGEGQSRQGRKPASEGAPQARAPRKPTAEGSDRQRQAGSEPRPPRKPQEGPAKAQSRPQQAQGRGQPAQQQNRNTRKPRQQASLLGNPQRLEDLDEAVNGNRIMPDNREIDGYRELTGHHFNSDGWASTQTRPTQPRGGSTQGSGKPGNRGDRQQGRPQQQGQGQNRQRQGGGGNGNGNRNRGNNSRRGG